MQAIDIALLPPKKITDLSVELNKKLVGPRNIKLNQIDQLPHITLLFGGAEEDQLETIWQELLEIVQNYEPLKLEIKSIRYGGSTGLHIQRTPELQSLHEELVKQISPKLNYSTTIDMFTQSEQMFERTIGWVNNYLQNSALKNYDPHITVGDGKLDEADLPQLPITFTADRIALCHLGNLCTCAEVLFETKLQ